MIQDCGNQSGRVFFSLIINRALSFPIRTQ